MNDILNQNDKRTLMQFRRSSYNSTVKKKVLIVCDELLYDYMNKEADEEKRLELIMAKKVYKSLFEDAF